MTGTPIELSSYIVNSGLTTENYQISSDRSHYDNFKDCQKM